MEQNTLEWEHPLKFMEGRKTKAGLVLLTTLGRDEEHKKSIFSIVSDMSS